MGHQRGASVPTCSARVDEVSRLGTPYSGVLGAGVALQDLTPCPVEIEKLKSTAAAGRYSSA